jgi:uncharacterized membrane protein YhaH (DUF805 family)
VKRTLLLALWLPLAVAAQAAVRFGFGAGPEPMPAPIVALAVVTLFLFTWPAGIPLTLAVRRLHARSRRAAYACAAVLGLLTTAASTVGGLLGPIAVWIYAAILSLPAWLVVWLLARRERRAAQ